MSALFRLSHLLRFRPNGCDLLATTALTLGLGSLCCAPAWAQAAGVNVIATDPILGSQLLGTAASTATALGGGATVAADGTISAPRYVVQGTGHGSAGDAFGATDRALSANAATIAAATTDLSGLRRTIIDGSIGLVQQDPTSRTVTIASASAGTQIDITGLAGNRRLSGLASGTVDSDAATLGQLRLSGSALVRGLGGGAALDAVTGTVTAPIYSVGGRLYGDVGSALAATNALSVQYVPDVNGVATGRIDLSGRGPGGPVALQGVANGRVVAGSTDAVNGGQLSATNAAVADLSLAIGAGSTGLVRQDVASRGLTVGASTDGATVGFASGTGQARTLTGVGNGRIAAGSQEAINGGQLQVGLSATATALGGGARLGADGSLIGPRYTVQGNTYGDVGSALGTLDTAVTNMTSSGSRYVAVNSTGNVARATGSEGVAVGAGSVASTAGGVALGSGAVADRVGLRGSREAFSGTSVASAAGAVSVGTAGGERQITHVAGGTAETDAVNLRQLRSTGDQLAAVLGGGSGFGADGRLTQPRYAVQGKSYDNVGAALGALDTYTVAYDVDPATGGRGQSLTLAGADPNKPVLIRNVADGIATTEAANFGQVIRAKGESVAYTDAKSRETLAAAATYTDQRVAPLQNQMAGFGSQLADLNRQIGDVRTEARRGAAIGLAAAALRFDDRPGKLSVAAGGGVWRGESAASFGLGYTLPDGSARVNATGVTAGRDFGVGAGASFTLN